MTFWLPGELGINNLADLWLYYCEVHNEQHL